MKPFESKLMNTTKTPLESHDAPLASGSPASACSADYRPLTPEELDSIMPPGELVHTLIGGGFTVIGCEMERTKILQLAREHGAELAGETATAMKHGAAIYDPSGRPTFVETDEAALSLLPNTQDEGQPEDRS